MCVKQLRLRGVQADIDQFVDLGPGPNKVSLSASAHADRHSIRGVRLCYRR